MSTVERAYVVSLAIPDNEAYTALTTLARMGLPVETALRADVWLATVDAEHADELDATVRTMERIFNPNKHELAVRADARPRPGEVWIGARDEAPATAVSGRAVAGLRGVVRRTAWRLLDEQGRDVAPDVLR